MFFRSIFATFLLAAFTLSPISAQEAPQNIILFIGDGMGPIHTQAAGMYAHGEAGTLFFESFPYKGEMTTYSANSSITDSAASGTAMATGIKVDNGVISLGNNGDLRTVLEHYRDMGKMTGLVTTTTITHATPAAFGAHTASRSNFAEIAQDYLTESRPNILFGGGTNELSITDATHAGYAVVTDRASLQGLNTEAASYVLGHFGSGYIPYEFDGVGTLPHLSEMTTTALNILDNDPDGFFVMIEGGRIDHAGHANDIQRNIHETLEFDNAVLEAIRWAKGRDDTLIIVTADHETGGMQIVQNNGVGQYPSVNWSTGGHTGQHVMVYGMGPGAEYITRGVIDNTDIFRLLQRIPPQVVGGVIISPTYLQGNSAHYRVQLRSQPTTSVTLSTSIEGQVNASPSSLVFTSENWNAPQFINVEVPLNTQSRSYIRHETSSADPTYDGIVHLNIVTVDPPQEVTELELLSPEGIITNSHGHPIYQWTDVSDSYELYLAANTELHNPIFWDTVSGTCDGTTCTFDLTTIDPTTWLVEGTYSVFLNPVPGNNNTWITTPFQFTLQEPAPSPVTIDPTTGLDTLQPTLHWTLEGTSG